MKLIPSFLPKPMQKVMKMPADMVADLAWKENIPSEKRRLGSLALWSGITVVSAIATAQLGFAAMTSAAAGIACIATVVGAPKGVALLAYATALALLTLSAANFTRTTYQVASYRYDQISGHSFTAKMKSVF